MEIAGSCSPCSQFRLKSVEWGGGCPASVLASLSMCCSEPAPHARPQTLCMEIRGQHPLQGPPKWTQPLGLRTGLDFRPSHFLGQIHSCPRPSCPSPAGAWPRRAEEGEGWGAVWVEQSLPVKFPHFGGGVGGRSHLLGQKLSSLPTANPQSLSEVLSSTEFFCS